MYKPIQPGQKQVSSPRDKSAAVGSDDTPLETLRAQRCRVAELVGRLLAQSWTDLRQKSEQGGSYK